MNNFGAFGGGPIRKDKTFFFMDYEALRLPLQQVLVENVPSLALRSGDLSVYPQQIRDVDGTPFAGNQIPAQKISPLSAGVMKYLFPLPNTGAPNAIAARVIADLGFCAIYLSEAGLTNTVLGLPDLGFLDLTQVAEHAMAIRGVVDLPLVVDADTGFGNELNVAHTVRALELAGTSAIQLEAQRAPKRCGHFDGKELVTAEEMASKIKAAVDSRRDEIVMIARTDACAVAERQRLVGKEKFDEMERKYAHSSVA